MFAKLLHCGSGLAQTDSSGTLMSLDDSTPENMPLDIKPSMIQSQTATLLLANLLPSLKLEATGTHSTGITLHLILLNPPNWVFSKSWTS